MFMKAGAEWQMELGKNITHLRLLKDIARETLAERADISMSALRNLESGKSTLGTFVKVILILGKEDWLKGFTPQISINPLDKVLKRKRASRVSKEQQVAFKNRKNNLKKYGLDIESYIRLGNIQQGKCGNPRCGKDLDLAHRSTHVDHDHRTGRIRSLMCSACNSALGLIQEDQERIIGLVGYLQKHQAK